MYTKDEIRERNLVDRYVAGALSEYEKARFEEYFINDPECLEELELAHAFQRDLKTAAAEDAARAVVARGVLGRLLSARVMRVVAGVASVAAIVVAALLVQADRRLNDALDPFSAAPQELIAQRSADGAVRVDLSENGAILEQKIIDPAGSVFRVAIHDASDALIWRDERVPVRSDRLNIVLRKGDIKPGRYRLVLEQAMSDGGFELYGEYALEIVN